MKAVVFHGIGEIALDEVPDPTIQAFRLDVSEAPAAGNGAAGTSHSVHVAP